MTQSESKLNGIASGPRFSEKTRLNSSKLTAPFPSRSKNLKAIYESFRVSSPVLGTSLWNGTHVELGVRLLEQAFERDKVLPRDLALLLLVGDAEEDAVLLPADLVEVGGGSDCGDKVGFSQVPAPATCELAVLLAAASPSREGKDEKLT